MYVYIYIYKSFINMYLYTVYFFCPVTSSGNQAPLWTTQVLSGARTLGSGLSTTAPYRHTLCALRPVAMVLPWQLRQCVVSTQRAVRPSCKLRVVVELSCLVPFAGTRGSLGAWERHWQRIRSSGVTGRGATKYHKIYHRQSKVSESAAPSPEFCPSFGVVPGAVNSMVFITVGPPQFSG